MTYCAAPFNSVRIESTRDSGASYRPCCMYKSSDQTYSNLTEYLQGTELQQLQQHFSLPGALPESCSACRYQEANGQTSLRQHFNSKFNQSQKITQLEIFPGNVCNLQCFMCDKNSIDKFLYRYLHKAHLINQ